MSTTAAVNNSLQAIVKKFPWNKYNFKTATGAVDCLAAYSIQVDQHYAAETRNAKTEADKQEVARKKAELLKLFEDEKARRENSMDVDDSRSAAQSTPSSPVPTRAGTVDSLVVVAPQRQGLIPLKRKAEQSMARIVIPRHTDAATGIIYHGNAAVAMKMTLAAEKALKQPPEGTQCTAIEEDGYQCDVIKTYARSFDYFEEIDGLPQWLCKKHHTPIDKKNKRRIAGAARKMTKNVRERGEQALGLRNTVVRAHNSLADARQNDYAAADFADINDALDEIVPQNPAAGAAKDGGNTAPRNPFNMPNPATQQRGGN